MDDDTFIWSEEVPLTEYSTADLMRIVQAYASWTVQSYKRPQLFGPAAIREQARQKWAGKINEIKQIFDQRQVTNYSPQIKAIFHQYCK